MTAPDVAAARVRAIASQHMAQHGLADEHCHACVLLRAYEAQRAAGGAAMNEEIAAYFERVGQWTDAAAVRLRAQPVAPPEEAAMTSPLSVVCPRCGRSFVRKPKGGVSPHYRPATTTDRYEVRVWCSKAPPKLVRPR